jgi:hypothetical protein
MGGMTLSVSSSLTASTIPTGSEAEIAFISAVTSSATVAATSYGAWYAAGAHHDPTYDPTTSRPSGAARRYRPRERPAAT